MPNPSQIVSQINLLVGSPKGAPDGQFQAAAEAFAQLCKDINDRLAQVQALLTSGLRSEALYTAEVEPNIATLCKAVEQTHAEEWDRICAERSLERAPKINTESLRHLKDAAAAEHAIKPILKRHRRLSLCVAPIRERLEVLRELVKADPGTAAWEQDVRTFEAARLNELLPLIKQPGLLTEISRAQDIVRELTDSAWRIKVPPDLLDNARRAVQRLQGLEALKEIKGLIPNIHAAHKSQDFQRVKTLMDELNDVTESRGVPMPAEIQTELLNVQEWVRREELKADQRKELNEACTSLRAALDRKADVVEVRQLWDAARAFDLALPDELEREAHLRIRNHEQARRRRTQLIVALIVLTVGGVIAGVVYQYREHTIRAKILAVQTQVNDALAAGKIESATAAIDALKKDSPPLLKRPDVIKLIDLIKKKAEAEAQRAAEFAALYKTAIEHGVDDPDGEAIEKLRALASTEKEKEDLDSYLRDVDKSREVRQESIDLTFRQQAAALSKDLKPISETRADKDADSLAADLVQFDKRLADLDANKQASENARITLEPARAKLRALHSAIKSVKSQKETDSAFKAALQSLADSVWSPTQHKQRLESIADEFPTNSRAASLKSAASQVNAWVAVQKWSEITEGWHKNLAVNRDTLADRIRIVDDYCRKNPGTPLIAAASDYLAYLTVAKKAISDKGPWRNDYKLALASPLVAELFRVKITNGKTYYLFPAKDNPRSSSIGTSFAAITSADISKTAPMEFKPGFVGKSEPSPQSLFAKAWLARINDFQDDAWDTFGLEAAHGITVQPEMDDLVRLVLLSKTFASLRQCAWGLDDIDSLARQIESKAVSDDAIWLNPDDPEAPARRNAATDLISKLPSMDDLIQRVKKKRQAMFKPLQFEVISNAVVLQQGTEWQILLQSKDAKELKNGQRMLITADKGKTLRDIGIIADGKPVVDLTRMIGVEEGTLVFICDLKE
jgi:hypothetical protein